MRVFLNEIWTANRIGAEGAKKISESLKINTTLTQLDLSSNWNTIIEKKWIVIKDVVRVG